MIFEQTDTAPFNELILSWNGIRPVRGPWTFWVALQKGEWLKTAEWGPSSQRSFQNAASWGRIDLDVVSSNQLCTSFRVKVEGEELDKLHSITAALSNTETHAASPSGLSPVLLEGVPRQSQMVLNHPRHKDLCSPTALSTALNYLAGTRWIDPALLAPLVHDNAFDIYGNWVLNTAESFNQTGIPCHAARLPHFGALHEELMQNRPVVASVKGTLPGAPKPYPAGHLLCVVGYEAGRVYCIDSAFANSEETFVSYDLQSFLAVWGARRNLAYVFDKKLTNS